MTPLDIAIRLLKQGNGGSEAEKEIRGVLAAAQLLGEEAAKAQTAQDKWNNTLARLDGTGLQKLAEDLRLLIAETEKAGGSTTELKKRLDDVQRSRMEPRLARDLSDVQRGARAATNDLQGLTRQVSYGAQMGRIFTEVLQGNFGALAQFPALLKGLWMAIRANPLGILLTAVSALTAGFIALREKFGWFKKDVEELPESISAAGQAAEDFATIDLNLEAQRDELEKLRAKYEEVIEAVRRLRQAQDGVNEAELGVVLADLNLQEQQALGAKGLSESEREGIRLDYSGRRERAKQSSAETAADDQSRRAAGDVKILDEKIRQNQEAVVTASDKKITYESSSSSLAGMQRKAANDYADGALQQKSSEATVRGAGKIKQDSAEKELNALSATKADADKKVSDAQAEIDKLTKESHDLAVGRLVAVHAAQAASLKASAVRLQGQANAQQHATAENTFLEKQNKTRGEAAAMAAADRMQRLAGGDESALKWPSLNPPAASTGASRASSGGGFAVIGGRRVDATGPAFTTGDSSLDGRIQARMAARDEVAAPAAANGGFSTGDSALDARIADKLSKNTESLRGSADKDALASAVETLADAIQQHVENTATRDGVNAARIEQVAGQIKGLRR